VGGKRAPSNWGSKKRLDKIDTVSRKKRGGKEEAGGVRIVTSRPSLLEVGSRKGEAERREKNSLWGGREKVLTRGEDPT